MTVSKYKIEPYNSIYTIYKIPFSAIEKANISLKDKDNSYSVAEHAREQEWDIAVNGVMFSNGSPISDPYYYWNLADLIVDGKLNRGGNYSDKGIAFGSDFKNIGAYWSTTANSNGKPVDFVGSAPTLLINGVISMDMKGLTNSFSTQITQRTAVGIDRSNIYIISTLGNGSNLYSVAVELKRQGCLNASNYDGGGSTDLFVDGRTVYTRNRNVTSGFGIKLKPDIIYTPAKPPEEELICALDAGHSSLVSGKQSPDGSYHEYECNINIVELVQSHLIRHGIKCPFVDYKNSNARSELIELIDRINLTKANIIVSFHTNGFGEGFNRANGWEAFYYDDARYPASKRLTEFIHKESLILGLTDRGIKSGNHLGVIRQTNMPSCLIETGFHTNYKDLARLKSQAFRKKAALAYSKGIVAYFGLKWIEEPVVATTVPSVLYKVQLGAFSNKDNAVKLQSNLKAKGYSTFIAKKIL